MESNGYSRKMVSSKMVAMKNEISFNGLEKSKARLFVLLIIVVGFNASSIAQKTHSGFSVNIGIGPSFPAGGFAKAPAPPSFAADDNAGNAMTGISGNIALQYQLKNRFGFSLFAGESINKRNARKQEESLKQNLFSDYKVKAETHHWKIFKIMPGIFYTIPLSNNSKFELQPMVSAGICKTAVPAESYVYYKLILSSSSAGAVQDKRALPVSFCYQLSAQLNYNVSKKVVFLTQLSYFDARPFSEKYFYTLNPISSAGFISNNKHYSLASFAVQAGAGVRL